MSNENTPKNENAIIEVKPEQLVDPTVQIDFAIKAAKGLTNIIQNNKIKPVIIGNKKHLLFEHWQMLARFFNMSVGTDEVKEEIIDGKVAGYKAKAVVYNAIGVIVGSAEASCFANEKNWQGKPRFQLKSMAQTRACAKALRNVLGWVVVLEGYNPTPAEEMDNETPAPAPVKSNEPTYVPYSEKLNNKPQDVLVNCVDCGKVVNSGVEKFSQSRYGKILCMECQPKHKVIK